MLMNSITTYLLYYTEQAGYAQEDCEHLSFAAIVVVAGGGGFTRLLLPVCPPWCVIQWSSPQLCRRINVAAAAALAPVLRWRPEATEEEVWVYREEDASQAGSECARRKRGNLGEIESRRKRRNRRVQKLSLLSFTVFTVFDPSMHVEEVGISDISWISYAYPLH